MNLTFEVEIEEDGRWIAEVPELPGVLAYGDTQEAAMAKAEALALRVLADRIENGEARPMPISIVCCTPRVNGCAPRSARMGAGRAVIPSRRRRGRSKR